jgi:protoporphyrinogen oxidase
MGTHVAKNGGRIHLNAQNKSIKELNIGVSVDSKEFDQVLITTPAPIAKKLTEGNISWPKIDYLWAQTLILELNKSLMDVYWLNILENDWPFLVAVEHTNFVHKSHYNKKTLIYLGNYLEEGDNRLEMTEKQLLNMFLPYIEKINPRFRKSWVDKMWKFQSPYSQPVFPTGFSKKIPPIKTKMKGVFVANMSMVYPFDRGTNYAVEIGVRAAKTMMQANLSLV